MAVERKLYRSTTDVMIGGVCAGIAEYFDIDVSLVRIVAAALLIAGWGSPVIVYLILWAVLPEKPTVPGGVETPSASASDQMADVASRVATSVAAGAQKVAQSVEDAFKSPSDPVPAAAPEGATSYVPEDIVAAVPPAASAATPSDSGVPSQSTPIPPVTPHPAAPIHSGGGGAGAGVVIGIVLVLFGILVLVGRMFTGVPIWTFWPLIIVAGGIVEAFTPGSKTESWSIVRLFEGFGTVVLGLVLLGCTTGVISWRVFLDFIMLWPLLVIAGGIGILGGALKMKWLRIAGSLIVTLTLIIAATTSFTGWELRSGNWYVPFVITNGSTSTTDYSVGEPLGNVRDASLSFKDGIGEIQIRSGDGGNLIALEGSTTGEDPGFEVVRSGSTAEITVDGKSGRTRDGMIGPNTTCTLSDRVVWDLRIDTAAASLDIDLEGLEVGYFELDSAASETTVRLGAPVSSDDVNVKFDTAVSSIKLKAPANAPVRIVADAALAGNSFPGLTKGTDGAWYSDNYSAASAAGNPVWNIDLDSAVAAFTFGTY